MATRKREGVIARPPLAAVHAAIIGCARCPRLRDHCAAVASVRKRAYRDDVYWGRPVPGYGDPRARVLVLGLAPAAHGANRTGRVFTGDSSGDFLMRALHAAGFASLPTSRHREDGLELRDLYLSAAVRCAPPDNKPLPSELAACASHLDAEIAALSHLEIVVALGRIAHDAYWAWLVRRTRGVSLGRKPPFGHRMIYDPERPGVPMLVDSYHPSRQNTNTGRLTSAMLDDVFAHVRSRLARTLHERSRTYP